MNIHDKIRVIRKSKQLSQEDVAEKLEMSTAGYAKIERGETKLNLDRLEQLAHLFKIDIVDLLKFGESGGLVFQLNEGDSSGGDISFYASNHHNEIELLKLKLKHAQELLTQKEKEIELLRKLLNQQNS